MLFNGLPYLEALIEGGLRVTICAVRALVVAFMNLSSGECEAFGKADSACAKESKRHQGPRHIYGTQVSGYIDQSVT